MKVIGVDPGGSTTGLVVRKGRDCIDHQLVERGDDFGGYLREVLSAIDAFDWEFGCDLICVEGLNPPNPHLGMTNVGWLMDTAQVLGAVRARWPDCVVVPPARHGKTPDLPQPHLDAYMADRYPANLIGSRERGGKYGGKLRHARSAFDVANPTVQQRFGVTT